MKNTLRLSLAVIGALLLILVLVREPAHWPAPEVTPYQGEAAEPTQLRHSKTALARLIREPQNTWSNLAFIVGGALLATTRHTRLARTMGVPLIAVGVGSFLYHASASTWLRQLDVGAMYWLFVLTVVYCVAIACEPARRRLEANAVLITIGSLAAATGFAFSRNFALGGFKPLSLTIATIAASAFLLLTIAHCALRRESVSAALQLLGILNLFGVAAYCQMSDRPGGNLYNPTALIQPHAIWHLMSATAFTWAAVLLDAISTMPAPKSAQTNQAQRAASSPDLPPEHQQPERQ